MHYLEKENRMKPENANENKPEHWFNGMARDIKPHEVRMGIDRNVAKLGREDSKFFLINISPSQKELAHLVSQYGEDGAKENLKEFAMRVMDEYARNFKRLGINNHRDLLWFGKLESYRYYSHNDKEVKNGQKKKGARKEGRQMHVQIIVSRKDITNRIKLSLRIRHVAKTKPIRKSWGSSTAPRSSNRARRCSMNCSTSSVT